MSKPFRGLSDPQMIFLRSDLVLIEHSDPGAEDVNMSTNTYALLKPGKAILLDTNDSTLLPFVQQLYHDGYSPVGLMISHRHVAGAGNAIRTIAAEYQIPVLLHPIDARHPQSRAAKVSFDDPIDHPLLREFGIETVLFPGHTEGHVIFYSPTRGGLLFTGDAAMSTTVHQAEAGLERLIRPPLDFNMDDTKLRQQWLAYDFGQRPVSTVLPYHGTGYLDRNREDVISIMQPLTRSEPTKGLLG